MAEIIGKVVFKLKTQDLYLKNRAPIVEFYKKMVSHEELKMRRCAAFNLPCFNKLYKEYQEELGVEFSAIYLRLA